MQATITQSGSRLPISHLKKAATHFGSATARLVCAGLLAITALISVASSSAHAQQTNSLETISASSQAGGKVLIRAVFKSPLAVVPNGFT
ncbi:MAG: hypothetical protein ACK45Y_12010, partial [Betaproteobacteria bacterium]